MLQALANTLGQDLNGLNKVTFHIDDADSHVHFPGDWSNCLKLAVFASGHFQVHFINLELKKFREQRRVAPVTHGMSPVIAETEVG